LPFKGAKRPEKQAFIVTQWYNKARFKECNSAASQTFIAANRSGK
jgi:hypothetical protein